MTSSRGDKLGNKLSTVAHEPSDNVGDKAVGHKLGDNALQKAKKRKHCLQTNF